MMSYVYIYISETTPIPKETSLLKNCVPLNSLQTLYVATWIWHNWNASDVVPSGSHWRVPLRSTFSPGHWCVNWRASCSLKYRTDTTPRISGEKRPDGWRDKEKRTDKKTNDIISWHRTDKEKEGKTNGLTSTFCRNNLSRNKFYCTLCWLALISTQ